MATLVGDDGGYAEAKDKALEFATYEDYLDSLRRDEDMYYLGVRCLALRASVR